jgi:hypothetical protein
MAAEGCHGADLLTLWWPGDREGISVLVGFPLLPLLFCLGPQPIRMVLPHSEGVFTLS